MMGLELNDLGICKAQPRLGEITFRQAIPSSVLWRIPIEVVSLMTQILIPLPLTTFLTVDSSAALGGHGRDLVKRTGAVKKTLPGTLSESTRAETFPEPPRNPPTTLPFNLPGTVENLPGTRPGTLRGISPQLIFSHVDWVHCHFGAKICICSEFCLGNAGRKFLMVGTEGISSRFKGSIFQAWRRPAL